MNKEIKLCECGCGREVTKPGNRFIHGHTWKNRTLFEETKKKLSEAKKGKNNPFYGRTHSEEAKKKVSEAKKGNTVWKGRVHSEEHKKKMSELNKGENNPRYGKIVSEETKKKMSKSQKGRKHTKETKKKISEYNKGEKCHFWKGGISFEPYCHKFTNEIKEQVRDEFGRMCFLCTKTEKENNAKLSIHHIDYNKNQGCDDHEWKLVPLCRSCHSKTSNGDRKYWEELILEKLKGKNEILNLIY